MIFNMKLFLSKSLKLILIDVISTGHYTSDSNPSDKFPIKDTQGKCFARWLPQHHRSHSINKLFY